MDHSLFLLKSFFGDLLSPLPLTLLLLVFALPALLRRQLRWFGILCTLGAMILLFVSSFPPLSNPLIAELESRFPAYQRQAAPHDIIVVLGSWHQTVAEQPLTSQVSSAGIVRLVEGLRIYRLNPGSRLVFTGFHGRANDPSSYPEKLKELAVALGVPEQDILALNGPRDTAEEARLIAELFPDAGLVLVTSAAHMARAMSLFRGAGLDPTAAPTDHMSKPTQRRWVLPDGRTLADTEAWVHEQLGQQWARLLGLSADAASEE
jgi:uncharacterized SAM-binding protein YcdF (DUF218 family)